MTKSSSKTMNEKRLERLVQKFAETSSDTGRAKVLDSLVSLAREFDMATIDSTFRGTKSRLRSYPAFLGRLMDDAEDEVVPILRKLIADADEVVAANAIEVARAQQQPGTFDDLFLGRARSGRMDSRRDAAIYATATLGTDDAAALLCDLARNPKLGTHHRRVVFRGLAESDNAEAQKLVKVAFDDPTEDPVVRCYAAYGVARLQDPRGLAFLWSNLALADQGMVVQLLMQSVRGLELLLDNPETWSSAPIMRGAASARRELRTWDEVLRKYNQAQKKAGRARGR